MIAGRYVKSENGIIEPQIKKITDIAGLHWGLLGAKPNIICAVSDDNSEANV